MQFISNADIYLSIDPEEIFKIVKVHLPKLLLAIQLIRNDIAANI